MSSKANSLREKTDNSAVLQKLLHEAKEYRGILKCGICHDRQKEVVIFSCSWYIDNRNEYLIE
jgi:E3 ubiquitin-protein ligase BRE1